MNCTETQAEILATAYLLAREGKGQVVTDDAIPDAHELAEQGWLERRFAGDELAWFWTAQAETALDLSALLQSAEGRQN
jgi:hypothetical protein